MKHKKLLRYLVFGFYSILYVLWMTTQKEIWLYVAGVPPIVGYLLAIIIIAISKTQRTHP